LEEAGLTGSGGGPEQGKLRKALLELKKFIAIKFMRVNSKHDLRSKCELI